MSIVLIVYCVNVLCIVDSPDSDAARGPDSLDSAGQDQLICSSISAGDVGGDK